MITTAAHAVNEGREPELEPGPDQDHDFHFIDRPNPAHALETVTSLVAERVPGGLGLDPIRDVQVLAPMYKTAVGIDALNASLQQRLNPNGDAALNERFRIGDRLIQTRNSHELGLMNGSICFIVDDDPDEEAIVLETDDGLAGRCPTTRPGRCAWATRSRCTRPRAARCRWWSSSATAPTPGC